MPGATTPRLDDPCAPICWNEFMMPQTVPNRPMNGVMLAVVARNGRRASSFVISTVVARSSARSTASRLLRIGRPPVGDGFPASACPPARSCAWCRRRHLRAGGGAAALGAREREEGPPPGGGGGGAPPPPPPPLEELAA